MLRKARAEGKGAVAQHPALKGGDLKKFYSHEFVFNVNVPHGLLKKVVFEIMFYFCRRGQENLHNLRVQDFEVVNSNGQKYVKKVRSELTKSHQGTTNETEGTGEGCMPQILCYALLSHLKSICLKDMPEMTDFSFIPKINSCIKTLCGTEMNP